MRTDLLWRSAVPVAAVVALLLDLPRFVPGTLALAGLVLAADRLARLRRLGLVDRVLVVLGGVLLTLVLTGMLLGSTDIGLSPTTWVLGLAVVALVGLGVASTTNDRVPPGPDEGAASARAGALRVLPWVAAAALVVAFTVRLSAASLSQTDAEPVEMSFGRVSGAEVEVVVSSSDPVGPLELRTSDGTNEISYPLIDVGQDGSVSTTVGLPDDGRFTVTLGYPEQTQPLRTLVLDR